MALDSDVFSHLLDTVERFVRERLMPLESQVEESDEIPDSVVEEMKSLGLFGLTVPEAYGGMGLTLSELVQVNLRMGYTSPAFRSVFGTNLGIGSQGILIDGTEEQKNEWLPKIASGDLIGSFALTEPDAGSDAGSLRCKAQRKGESYILNGVKRFITNAPRAGVFTVMARTGTQEEGPHGVSAFIVDAKTKGVELGPKDKKMGQRGTYTCDVFFEDAVVPASCLIGGKEGQGFKTAMKVLDAGRLHIAAVSVGIANRLLDEAVRYASERKQFGKVIGEFQLIQGMLADSYTEYLAGRSMIEKAAAEYDNGIRDAKTAAACKYYCTEMVGRLADRAVQIHGGAGYMSEYAVEHFYRDVRLFRLYEGTSQIQQLVIARGLLKEWDGEAN